jgi:sugar/nucleoside kinase (ribokinase family)
MSLWLAKLHVNAKIISRIGNDVLGNTLTKYVKENNITTDTIQVDNPAWNRSGFTVHLDNKGSTSCHYKLSCSLQDRIELNSLSETIVKESNTFVFLEV